MPAVDKGTIATAVAELNSRTEEEAPRIAGTRRVGVIAPFAAGMSAFWRAFFGGAWRSGARGVVASGLAALERTVLFMKAYFSQRNPSN